MSVCCGIPDSAGQIIICIIYLMLFQLLENKPFTILYMINCFMNSHQNTLGRRSIPFLEVLWCYLSF